MAYLSFVRLSLMVSAVMSVITSVHATEAMRIPANKNATMDVQAMQQNPEVHQLSRRANGKVNIAYYVNCMSSSLRIVAFCSSSS